MFPHIFQFAPLKGGFLVAFRIWHGTIIAQTIALATVMQCILFIFTIYSSNVQFVPIQINLALFVLFFLSKSCVNVVEFMISGSQSYMRL